MDHGTGQAKLGIRFQGIMAAHGAKHTSRELSAELPILITSGPLSAMALQLGTGQDLPVFMHPPWQQQPPGAESDQTTAATAGSRRGRKRAASTRDEDAPAGTSAVTGSIPQEAAQLSETDAAHAQLVPPGAVWCEVGCEEGGVTDVTLKLQDANQRLVREAECAQVVIQPLPGWHAGLQLLEVGSRAQGGEQPLQAAQVEGCLRLPGGGKAVSKLRLLVPRMSARELAALPPQRLLIAPAGQLPALSQPQAGAPSQLQVPQSQAHDAAASVQEGAGGGQNKTVALVIELRLSGGSYPAALAAYLPGPVWGHLATEGPAGAGAEGAEAGNGAEAPQWLWAQGGQQPGHQPAAEGRHAAIVYNLGEYSRWVLMLGFVNDDWGSEGCWLLNASHGVSDGWGGCEVCDHKTMSSSCSSCPSFVWAHVCLAMLQVAHLLVLSPHSAPHKRASSNTHTPQLQLTNPSVLAAPSSSPYLLLSHSPTG